MPGAAHTACTVEMVSTSRVIDVAVVDEVQLAADPSRGWSFTRQAPVAGGLRGPWWDLGGMACMAQTCLNGQD